MPNKKHIVLGVTASIAIYKACEIVRRLGKEGYSISVVMTDEAKELISPMVFQSLSGNRVYSGYVICSGIDNLTHRWNVVKSELVTAHRYFKIAGQVLRFAYHNIRMPSYPRYALKIPAGCRAA